LFQNQPVESFDFLWRSLFPGLPDDGSDVAGETHITTSDAALEHTVGQFRITNHCVQPVNDVLTSEFAILTSPVLKLLCDPQSDSVQASLFSATSESVDVGILPVLLPVHRLELLEVEDVG
jgi:hypothetical protein